MSRYLSSFLIALSLYSSLVFAYLYSFDNKKLTPIAKQKKKEVVKFRVITKKIEPKKIEKNRIEPKVVEPKKIEKKIIKPKKVKKKIVKKRKRKPKRKVKKIREKKIPTPKKIEKEVIKKEIVTKTTPIKPKIDKKKLQLKQNRYYAKIKQTIEKNKSYPQRAVRREIEGVVKIKFTISTEGKLLSFKIIEGKKIFRKSIIEAIQNSFPLKPPKDTFKTNLNLSIAIKYKLYN